MNKYAQLYEGKIIYFYETEMKIEELTKIFSPNTFWVDVTAIPECELGWEVTFDSDCKMHVTAPKKNTPIPPTLDELKQRKLGMVNQWTKRKIVGGFKSDCYNGQIVTYDSDVETQITVQGICLNVKTELFKQRFPNGCPMRGYAEGASEKTIFMFSPDQLLKWQADLSTHIGLCKQEGWAEQLKVENAQSEEDLDRIILEEPEQISLISDK